MEFIKPCKQYLDSYYKAMQETYAETLHKYIIHNPEEYENWKDTIFTDYENNEKGINLPKGFIPSATFWLVDNGEYIGTANIRLGLTDALKYFGGNVGFIVKKSARGRGYGEIIAKLSIEKARELLGCPVLVTCFKDNLAATKNVEKCGVISKSEEVITEAGKTGMAVKYWL